MKPQISQIGTDGVGDYRFEISGVSGTCNEGEIENSKNGMPSGAKLKTIRALGVVLFLPAPARVCRRCDGDVGVKGGMQDVDEGAGGGGEAAAAAEDDAVIALGQVLLH